MRNLLWLTGAQFESVGNEPALAEWTQAHAELAHAEGWGIDERFAIVRDDHAARFCDDLAARAHVRERASQGSEAHVIAIAMHERYFESHSEE